MNTPKRVSFGSKGSMVETWIIYDGTDNRQDSDGRSFQEKQLLNNPGHDSTTTKNKVDLRVTFSDTTISDSRQAKPMSPNISQPNNTDSYYPQVIYQRPLTRSQSLVSRDNPFVPGGDLSVDTDDILKRATIIQTKFILDEKEKLDSEKCLEAVQDCKQNANISMAPSATENDGKKAKESTKKAELEPQSIGVKEAPKENGKVEDSCVSPDAVKVESPQIAPSAEGQLAGVAEAPKEKKKQKKCCAIM